ncbi:hypothetical protein DJ568_05505 [Mucilaginibacter hurinus]|uniref:Uncharacterized protein n=1 Tax=Mucilaginibacter hurinus TaxID=2201324 RepID=A0A367GTP1_9SPHI|nr:hypothetical protein [Mucilaginibacter hurinus]RCH56196.1 hypothetical protein DJ568_05505 [Mucilaginibacter hurinus]
MHRLLNYNVLIDDFVRHLTITPVNELLPSGDYYSTGIYKIHEGNVGMGQVVFDLETDDWEYDGYGELTHKQVEDIAAFIRKHRYDGDNEE